MTIAYFYQFFWGILIFAAFVGWGRIVQNCLVAERQSALDWGLAAGWGMAATLVFGGLLSSFGLVSRELLIGFVVIGAIFCAPDAKALLNLRNRTGLILIGLSIPLLVRYASAVHFQAMSCADDDIAYFPMIIKLLDTGTLLEPFSLRRLAGFGGHTFLQALVGATGTEDNGFLMDRGVALLVCFGLVFGFFKEHRGHQLLAGALAVLLIVVLPFPLLNSASHLTGLAIFLTLFRTLSRQFSAQAPGHANVWLIGAIVAAAGSLRAHYLFVAALTVVIYWLICYIAEKKDAGRYFLSLCYVGLASLVWLSPWMVLLQMSSESILYPLFSGNHRPEFENYSAPLAFSEHVSLFAATFFHGRIVLFLAPVMLFLFRRKNTAALALYISSIIGTMIMTWVFTYSDVENIHRYVAPFLNAAFVGTLLAFFAEILRTAEPSPSDLRVRKISNLVLVGVILIVGSLMMVKDAQRIAKHWDRTLLSQAERAKYVEMQNSLPQGARVMAMVNHPFALNYRRNDILNVDVPGAASPDPGMPFKQGPGKLKKYLQSLSITHLVFGDLNDRPACLYNRALWEFHRDGDVAAWKFGAPYYLDLMDNVEALARSEKVLYRKDGFHVVAFD